MWINTHTHKVYNYHQQIREDFASTSFPDVISDALLAEFGVLPITQTTPVFDSIRQSAVESAPALVNGVWTQQWLVTDLPAAQVAANLTASRASIWERIKTIRDNKTQNGGFPAAGKWFHSDTFSRTQQIGLVMMGAGIPAGLQWKTMDGTFVTMTPTLAGQIFAAAAAQDAATFAHAEALRAQVEAAADPATVDITAGWPATYA